MKKTTNLRRRARRARGDFSVGADPSGFCMPTDVAIAQDGTFWVSDGYCKARRALRRGRRARGVGPARDGDRERSFGFRRPALDRAGFPARAAVGGRPRARARVTEHALDGTPLAAHDFGEHGYVYHVATLAAEDDGMSQRFYALAWTRRRREV